MSTRQFDEFVHKYGTPLSILIGAVIIGASIFLSVNPDFKFSLKSGDTNGVENQGQPSQAGQAVAPSGVVKNIDTKGLPMLGKSSAKVSVVEFADFQCPFCARHFNDTVSKIKTDYVQSGKVKFFYNDFAFLGEESFLSAQAAKCADDQDKFWPFHDYLYAHQSGENQGAFSLANLKKFAGEVGLNQSQFDSCMDSKKYEQAVKDETARAKTYGVTATPTTAINGELVQGAVPYDTIKAKIEEKLK